jgi:UDP-N-acetylmuramate dehydrogenase
MAARVWHEEAVAALQGRAGVGLLTDVPLSSRTYIGVGGPARVFLEPRTVEDLAWAIARLAENDLPFDVLGAGSNLLVADEGPSFVVVSCARLGSVGASGGAGEPVITGPSVRAGAGFPVPRLVKRLQKAGLAGLEFAEGIPGSVGGAVRMNAGWHEGEFGPRVRSLVAVTRRGAIETLDCGPGFFVYRKSPGLGDRIVAEARLELTPDDPAGIAERMRGFRDHRVQTQPTGERNAGCMFKNPAGDHAGRLIDQSGLKGTRVGAAEVSPIHANFFINRGGARAADVRALLDRVRDEVHKRTGITLEPEVVTWS